MMATTMRTSTSVTPRLRARLPLVFIMRGSQATDMPSGRMTGIRAVATRDAASSVTLAAGSTPRRRRAGQIGGPLIAPACAQLLELPGEAIGACLGFLRACLGFVRTSLGFVRASLGFVRADLRAFQEGDGV